MFTRLSEIFVKFVRSFFKHLGGPSATFQKTAVLPMRKKLAHFFWFYRSRRTSEISLLSCTKNSGNLFACCNTICVTPKRLLKKHKVRKKAVSEEKNLSTFFCIIEHERQHGLLYRSLQCISTNVVQVRKSFP